MNWRCLLVSLLWCATAQAADAPSLMRGINLSNWLANAARQPLDARDFRQIKQSGFDHVRLPVNPELIGFSFTAPTALDFTTIDQALAWAQHEKLAVVLDIHPSADFKKTLEEDPGASVRFAELWRTIAQHYVATPTEYLVFELLNEPQYYGAESAYQRAVTSWVAAVRTVDADRAILVGAPRGSSVEGLQRLTPIADPNIRYDVHFYAPYMVTHQGISFGFSDRMLRYFRGVPYPSHLAGDDARLYAVEASNPAQAQRELDAYRVPGWDANRIAAQVRIAGDWAARHGVSLYCGEFGVLRQHSDTASRYRWITDMRRALEAQAIGWALWDYTDLFGITTLQGNTTTDPVDGSVRLVNPAAGSRHIEPEALHALFAK